MKKLPMSRLVFDWYRYANRLQACETNIAPNGETQLDDLDDNYLTIFVDEPDPIYNTDGTRRNP